MRWQFVCFPPSHWPSPPLFCLCIPFNSSNPDPGSLRRLLFLLPTTARAFDSCQRRSTVEVHPNFSEAQYLRSSIPHPKTDLNKKPNWIPTNHPMAQVTNMPFFETNFGILTILGFRIPVIQKTFYRKFASSIVERVIARRLQPFVSSSTRVDFRLPTRRKCSQQLAPFSPRLDLNGEKRLSLPFRCCSWRSVSYQACSVRVDAAAGILGGGKFPTFNPNQLIYIFWATANQTKSDEDREPNKRAKNTSLYTTICYPAHSNEYRRAHDVFCGVACTSVQADV